MEQKAHRIELSTSFREKQDEELHNEQGNKRQWEEERHFHKYDEQHSSLDKDSSPKILKMFMN